MKKLILSLTLLLTVSMSAFAQINYNGIEYEIISETDKTVEVYSGKSFNGSELIIPDKVTDCEEEYTVTGIFAHAFYNNKSITSVSIPATVKNIGNDAFYKCINLTSVTFEGESQLEHIGNSAFKNTVLKTIDIPASVISIGTCAFGDNTALQKVYMHRADPSYYSSMAFLDCPNLTIYAPLASYEAYNTKFKDYNKVEVPMDIFKPYALNTIEEGLNALNTLSDDDRERINEYLSDITTKPFDAAYAAFNLAMPIINDQSNLEKKLKDAIGIFATRKPGPTIEIRANDGTTIKLYNIEKVNFGKEGE